MKTILVLLLAAASAAWSCAQTTYVSNLAGNSDNAIFVRDNLWVARSFTTGANVGGYALDWANFAFNGGSDPTLSVGLWSSNGFAAPNVELETLTNAGGGQFTSPSQFTLAANTTYWLVLQSSEPFNAATSYTWSVTFDPTKIELDGWTLASSVSSSTNGATWDSVGSLFQLSVTAAPIPEPSTWATIAGVVALGLALLRRRRTPAV